MKPSDPSQTTRTPEHPAEHRLAAFARGDVDDQEAAQIETHVLECDTCRVTLETAPDDGLIRLMRSAAAGLPQSSQLRVVEGYDIVEELGRGGMGVVYQARQQLLNRHVALKMIARGDAACAEDLARFRGEAEAIARLRHPNIVQVYEVGELDGRPYLAMELVEGGTLAQRLQAGPLDPRCAAELVATLAEAMEHAHEQGVVHRDLKPANILLTTSNSGGQELEPAHLRITDFGLARRLDTPDGYTRTGVVVGTPEYIAPELAGGGGEVTERADVHALGVILYELSTGRPPYRGTDVLETLQQVRTRDPVRPTRQRAGIPHDLETICLKCLEKAPERRYSTAGALADDLRRYLEGRPILAQPPSVWIRATKWTRRHPLHTALIGVSAAAIMTLVIAGGVYNARLRSALDQTRLEKQRADHSFQKSFDAVNRMLERVGLSELADMPEMEQVREDLLVDAVELYEELLAREPAPEPAARRRYYSALAQLGRIHDLLGHKEEAARVLRRAISMQEELCERFPDESEYARDLAISRINLGYTTSDRDAACEEFRSAIALLESIDDLPDARFQLALAINNLATRAIDSDESLKLYRQALAIREELVRREPDDPEYRHGLAQTRYNLAMAAFTRGNLNAAEESFRETISAWEQLTTEYPRVTPYQSSLAEAYTSLAFLLQQSGRTDEAEAAVRQGTSRRETLAARFPRIPTRQLDLARGRNMLAAIQMLNQRSEAAIPTLVSAVEVAERIQRQDPSIAHRNFTAEILTNLATAYSNLQRHQEATVTFRRAIGIYEDVLATAPDEPRYSEVLGIACMNFSNVLRGADPQKALEFNDRAVVALERCVARLPDRADLALHALRAHGARALTLMALQRHADAVTDWDRVIALSQPESRDGYVLHRGLTLAYAGNTEGAVESIQELLDRPSNSGPDLYNFACIYSLAAAAASETGAESTAKRLAVRSLELLSHDDTVTWLQTPGAFDQLLADDDLNYIRSQPAFEQLRDRMRP